MRFGLFISSFKRLTPTLRMAGRVLLFTGIFFAIDSFFFLLADRANRGVDAKIRLVYSYLGNPDRQADILIMGSSHPCMGVVSSILSIDLGGTAFNMAYPNGGQHLERQYYLLRKYLANKKPPRLLIVGVDLEMLNVGVNERPRNVFLKALAIYGPPPMIFFQPGALLFFSKAFYYRSGFIDYGEDALQGNWQLPRFRDVGQYAIHADGFLSLDGHGPGVRKAEGTYRFQPTPIQLQMLGKMVELTQHYQIETVWVTIPELRPVSRQSDKSYALFNKWWKDFAHTNKTRYFNVNDTPAFATDREDYFYDSAHLNGTGAERCTRELVKMLKDRVFQFSQNDVAGGTVAQEHR